MTLVMKLLPQFLLSDLSPGSIPTEEIDPTLMAGGNRLERIETLRILDLNVVDG